MRGETDGDEGCMHDELDTYDDEQRGEGHSDFGQKRTVFRGR